MFQRLARNRRLAVALSIALTLIMFVTLNTAANIWLRGARLDLTENGLYTLSDGTRSILRALKEPVTLRFYYSPKQAAAFPSIRAHGERVRDMLKEYRQIAGGNLIVDEIDPVPFTESEDRAVADGIQGAPVEGGDPVYMGLAGTNMADGHEVIPLLTLDREQFLEYDLSSMVARLAAVKKPVLGVVSSLPLDAGPGGEMAAAQGRAQPYVIYAQLAQIFDARMIGQDFRSVPTDIDALMIVHPKALSQKTLYAIDQFVMRGGRVLAFVDPVSEMAQMLGGTSQDRLAYKSDLWLLKSWGVTYTPDEVVLDRGRAQTVQYGADPQRPTIAYPVWLALKADKAGTTGDFDTGDLVTASLTRLNLASVGRLSQAEGATTSFTPLLRSSEDAMLTSGEMLQMQSDPDELMRAFSPTGERYTLAARISGPMKSAFTEGAPQSDAKDAVQPLPPHIPETQNANIIVTADSDLFDDRFWAQTQRQGGEIVAVPVADNLAYVAGAAENMLGSNDLIRLRARASSERPFTVVENLKRQADARFLREEQDLQAAILETEEKLKQLSQPAGGDPAAVTPEQEAEVSKFKAELTRSRARLRDVEHQLRAGINRLGNGLAAINITLMPVLLTIAALVFGWTRRRRLRAAQMIGRVRS
jgi:ABC-type uncharacterized transport system involved in gliding motility auxiliary subunit